MIRDREAERPKTIAVRPNKGSFGLMNLTNTQDPSTMLKKRSSRFLADRTRELRIISYLRGRYRSNWRGNRCSVNGMNLLVSLYSFVLYRSSSNVYQRISYRLVYFRFLLSSHSVRRLTFTQFSSAPFQYYFHNYFAVRLCRIAVISPRAVNFWGGVCCLFSPSCTFYVRRF